LCVHVDSVQHVGFAGLRDRLDSDAVQNVSAPCDLDWPKGWDNQINCYIPFTYGVPLTLSGSARVNGHLSGNMEWDDWFFSARANLMGIVSEPGRPQVAADDVQIYVFPEPQPCRS
jgi:hypothetical protein